MYLPIITLAGTAFHSNQNVMNDDVTSIIPGINTVVKQKARSLVNIRSTLRQLQFPVNIQNSDIFIIQNLVLRIKNSFLFKSWFIIDFMMAVGMSKYAVSCDCDCYFQNLKMNLQQSLISSEVTFIFQTILKMTLSFKFLIFQKGFFSFFEIMQMENLIKYSGQK